MPREPVQAKPAEASNDSRTLGIAAVVIALACVAGLLILPRIGHSARPHQPAPGFTLPVVMNGDPGARMSLDDLKGKPVLIDFWAYWCGPCRMQGPIVDRVYARYKDRGLVVIGISVDGTHEQAVAGAQAAHMTYPVLSDDTREVGSDYGAQNLPMLVLIDKDGNVVDSTKGLTDESSLDAMVRDVL
jgi:cytochrome c biogenesis protein CcmG, thiol:disulfide interchange protein DsbE